MPVATRERPIIFTGESVRAILAGTKTQTRRVVKRNQPFEDAGGYFQWWPGGRKAGFQSTSNVPSFEVPSGWAADWCPYGKPGDRLWVRETWKPRGIGERCAATPAIYRAEYTHERMAAALGPWKSPIFMPRWASRLLLEITDVRVQRVQDISEEDARAEGISEPLPAHGQWCTNLGREGHWSYRKPYAALWDSINAKRGYGWESNPWVWAIEFRRVG